MSSAHDPAKTRETVQLMLSIAADLRRLRQLGSTPEIPRYLDMGPRLEGWAEELLVTADQAAHLQNNPDLQQLVRDHQAGQDKFGN